MLALARHVATYVESEGFRALTAEAEAIHMALAEVEYGIRVRGATVTVLRYDGLEDVGAAVERTFTPFRRGAVHDYRGRFRSGPEVDHVEGQILDRVAVLFDSVFGRLRHFCEEVAPGRAFVESTLDRLVQEAPFYLAYLDYVEPVRGLGLPLCYPEIAGARGDSLCQDLFDLVLAHKLAVAGQAAVVSDWQAAAAERGFVVTGPNHAGKTTFARALGQVHVLAGLGLPVPGRRVRVPAVDAVFTHFPRAEQAAESPRSQFEDELVRLRQILTRATATSLVVINEMLSGTTLQDGVDIGHRVLQRLCATETRFVWVTFIEDLARAEDVVSLVCETDETFSPTFRIARGAPSGVARAIALAHRYGVDGAALQRRLGTA